ncbi:MAG: TatD family hydrolase, partial [candidate division Zixibacteria bacterium]
RQYDSDRDEVIRSGFDSGLEAIVNIGTDLESSRKSIELGEKHKHIYVSVGVHPHDSKDCPKDYIRRLGEMTTHKKVVAIGEMGLDYYRNLSPRDTQKRIFNEQLELALRLELPVVVHIRESIDESLRILEKSGIKRGVLHSFPGDEDEAKAGIDMGFFISFAGPITYPKSTRPPVAKSLPLSRIVAETDSPYLTPQAFRGKRNKPEYVRFVIDKLTEILSPYAFHDIDRITSYNARRLFGLPLDKTPKIAYKIRQSLYLNLTNRCSCNCYFCPRTAPGSGYVAGHYLRLKTEPTAEQVLSAINAESDFDEIVFCGLGESTIRLKELLQIARVLKADGRRTRLNTNGHGSLINKTDLPSKLAASIDKISVSLNAHDAQTYVKICKPDHGQDAYQAMIEFIKGCRSHGIRTVATVVDIPEVDLEACRKLSTELGTEFRIRKYSKYNL